MLLLIVLLNQLISFLIPDVNRGYFLQAIELFNNFTCVMWKPKSPEVAAEVGHEGYVLVRRYNLPVHSASFGISGHYLYCKDNFFLKRTWIRFIDFRSNIGSIEFRWGYLTLTIQVHTYYFKKLCRKKLSVCSIGLFFVVAKFVYIDKKHDDIFLQFIDVYLFVF